MLTNTYNKLGYITSRADPCVRYKVDGDGYTITDTYTDDVFGVSKTDEEIAKRKDEIGKEWEIKDVGGLYCALTFHPFHMELFWLKPHSFCINFPHSFHMEGSWNIWIPEEIMEYSTGIHVEYDGIDVEYHSIIFHMDSTIFHMDSTTFSLHSTWIPQHSTDSTWIPQY